MLATAPGLTEQQRRIAEWGDGPLVVIAGAGTGKTRVIVERVRWLLETRGDATVDESFAAFVEFDRRLECPPRQDPNPPAPGTHQRLGIDENFRSVDPVLAGANRLIERSECSPTLTI